MAIARHPRIAPPTLEQALSRKPGPPQVPPSATVGETLPQLLASAASIVAVTENGDLRGVLSDHDYVRFAALGGTPQTPISQAMSPCTLRGAPHDLVETWLAQYDEGNDFLLAVFTDGQFLGLLNRAHLVAESDLYHRRVFAAMALDNRIMFLQGTYSC